MAMSNGSNGYTPADKTGLNVIIVGAGIGGLTAAIALRQQGHNVQIYEQSRFASETGAAIHLAPNSNGVLKRLGIHADQTGANLMEVLTEYSSSGELTRSMRVTELNKIWQHEWVLAHRVHLHSALKTAATSELGEGPPAELHLQSSVTDVDVKNATITLKDGSKVSGDVVVGADGVHSVTRRKIPGGDVEPFGSGKSAFRFLIERKAAQEDPVTRKFAEKDGELIIWYGPDRRVVMYPTSNNRLLNFVCIHPEHESDASGDWNNEVSHQKLLDAYKTFPEDCVKLIEKADPKSLKAWKLLDMPVIPHWVNERLVILGDAAHPFLPHQGQGGGVAIEDGAALGIVLEKGVTREEVPERLQLWEKIRYERASRIQEYSRQAGRDISPTDIKKFNMIEYTNYNFGHDEVDNSTQKLREWKWAKTPHIYWRMPIVFGPMPGPRQTHAGIVRNATQSTFTTASVKFKTSRTVLQNLFPSGSKKWRFKSPGTVAYASFSQTTLNKMEWLGGSGYRHIGLYIHGVEYEKDNGEVISGTYMPILFESLTDPIVSGREELGMPKLYSAVDVYRRAESYRINTSWEGAIWGNFVWEGLKPVSDLSKATGKISGEDDDGILVHRYIPKVGAQFKGEGEAEYSVFVPFAEEKPQPVTQRVYQATKASFKIDALDWDALPTLHHVISRLAELPVYEVVGGKIVEGEGVPDVGAARRIE